MSMHVVAIVIAGIVLGLLMRATISMSWGSPVPLGLPLLIAVADVAKPKEAIAIFVIAIGVRIIVSIVRHGSRSIWWLIARCVVTVGTSALWWKLGTHTQVAHITIEQTFRAFTIATPVFFVDVVQEKVRYRRLDLPVLKRLALTHLSVFLSALLLSLAYRAHDINLAVLPAVIAAVLWYGSKSVVKNKQTVAEATTTMGTFPELTKFAPAGHSQRMVVLAGAMGEQASFGPTRLEYLVRGAAVARIGYIAYPDIDAIHEGYEIPSREEVAEHTEKILSKADFLSDLMPLIDGFLRADKSELTLDQAILRVAANFDDLSAEVLDVDNDEELIRTAIARTRELVTTRVESQAVRLLEDAFEAMPHLVNDLRKAGQLREDIRAEIETRMAGRGVH